MAITPVEVVVGGGTTGTSFNLTSWTPSANDLVLAAAVLRDETKSVSFSGNNLTWSQLHDINGNQGQHGLNVWQGVGASPSSGQINCAIGAGNTLPVTIIACRFSGVDTTTPIEASNTTVGPATDDNDMLLAVTTLTANAIVVAFGATRSRLLTVPGGENKLSTSPDSINVSQGASGDIVKVHGWYEGPIASPASTQLGALDDLSNVDDWCMAVYALKPASIGAVNIFGADVILIPDFGIEVA